ncbi:MAG: 30S ribosomal protein S20 [Patescibacteria group bacterium]
MPVIKSAKKKLRKDKVREKRNSVLKLGLKKALSAALKKPTQESIKKAVILADKNAKSNLLHENKVARIKSRLSKLIKTTPKAKPSVKIQKTKSSKAKK